MVRQAAKFMRPDAELLRALIGVRRVIQMDGACCAFHPMLAERVGTPQRVGFRRGPVHDEVLEVQGQHLGLFLGLRRNERLESLRRNHQHQQAIAQAIDDVEVACAVVARGDRVLKFIANVNELIERMLLPGRQRVASEGVPVEKKLDDGEHILPLGGVVLGHVDAEDFALIDVRHGAGIGFVGAEDFSDLGGAEVFEVVLGRADFAGALLLRFVLQVGLLQRLGETNTALGRLQFRELL